MQLYLFSSSHTAQHDCIVCPFSSLWVLPSFLLSPLSPLSSSDLSPHPLHSSFSPTHTLTHSITPPLARAHMHQAETGRSTASAQGTCSPSPRSQRLASSPPPQAPLLRLPPPRSPLPASQPASQPHEYLNLSNLDPITHSTELGSLEDGSGGCGKVGWGGERQQQQKEHFLVIP